VHDGHEIGDLDRTGAHERPNPLAPSARLRPRGTGLHPLRLLQSPACRARFPESTAGGRAQTVE